METITKIEQLQKKEKLKIILFYTEKSQSSLETLGIFKELHEEFEDIPIYTVNASKVRTIHPVYHIDSVPAVLVIRDNENRNIIYGKQTKNYYEKIFLKTPLAINNDGGSSQPNVTVYSTPTCTYCNQLKTYLRKNRIFFNDVDVAVDPNAAQELQQRTGQTGVPQTDIDGEIIVGFDRPRINELLGIKK